MELKKKLLSYYGWFEFTVIILVFIAPYFLEPAWAWRLILVYLVLIVALIFVVQSLIYPELLFQEHVDIRKVNPYLKLAVYIGTVIILVFMSWYVLIPMSIDMGALIFQKGMTTSVVDVEDTQYGGAGPYFIAQTLEFNVGGELRNYYLPFYRLPLVPGTYELVYSPRTYFTWDVIRKVR